MLKKISLMISIVSLIVSLTQLVYAQSDEKNIPDDFDKRWNRASELLEKGEYKEAISTYMILISSLEKGEVRGACWYNVACAYMRLKNERSALLSLGFAIKDGFRKADQFEADEDLKPLQKYELFKHYLELLKENKPEVLDNLDIKGLVEKYLSEPEEDSTKKFEEMLNELYKYVDEKVEKLREEAHKEIEDLIEQLRKGDLKTPDKKYTAYLGILVEDLTESTKQFFRLPKNQGVLINSVTPGSPAEKAGLFPLDIILMCNGKDVENAEMMKQFVRDAVPESTMRLQILRDRKRIDKFVKLGKKIKKDAEDKAEDNGKLGALEHGMLGIRLDQVDKGLRIMQVEAGSPADKAGIKVDDVIFEIDGEKIENLMSLKNFIGEHFVGDVLNVKVLRGEKELVLKLKIGKRPKIESKTSNPRVKINTNVGSFVVELFEDEAPNTVANFIELCENKFYDDIRFHRIIKDFMIQVGCPFARGKIGQTAGSGDAGYKFADEFSSKLKFNEAGLLAMANSGPNTNGSQIFITTRENCSWLDGKHAIFGKVVEGMDVVYKIAETPVEKDPKNPQLAKPTKDVYIQSTEVIQKRDHEYHVKKLED